VRERRSRGMLGRHVYRVTLDGDTWRIAKDGEAEARGARRSRDDAIAYACDLAKADEPARVTVESPDGKIVEEHKFGVDPGQSIAGA
jgi:hypothetical protein